MITLCTLVSLWVGNVTCNVDRCVCSTAEKWEMKAELQENEDSSLAEPANGLQSFSNVQFLAMIMARLQGQCCL